MLSLSPRCTNVFKAKPFVAFRRSNNLSNILVSAKLPGGGGGTNQILIRGGSARRSNPLPFYIPFWQKRYPIYIPFIEERYPFHIPTLGSLVLIFM